MAEIIKGDGISVRKYADELAAKIDTLPLESRKKLFDSIRRIVPKPYLSKYCPPTLSPKQEAFLCSPNLEILYGGAAGGGKTAALLIAALQYADQPNYDALIIRRTYAELDMPGATMSLARKWLGGTDAKWRDGKRWEFCRGATLTFGYLSRDDDRWQYQSANYNSIAFDEAAEFPNETTYRFLFSRLRRGIGVQIPPRMRLGANPIGPGAVWLKKRFITFPYSEELRSEPCFCEHFHWKEQCKDCSCPSNPNSEPRLYVPAKLSDNPFIDQNSYLRSLMQLDPYTRQALMDGDWDAKPPGKMFRREWFKLTPWAKQGPYTFKVRFWDLAATQEDRNKNPSWTCGVKMSYDSGMFAIEHVVRIRETPGTVKDLVKQTAQLDGSDVEIWIEQEPGSSGIAVIDDYIRSMPRYAIRPFKVSGSKEIRAAPMASQAEAGNVKIVESSWNEAFLEEVEQFPSTKWKNDQVDAASGAYNVLAENGDFIEPEGYGERIKPDWNMT
jgi:predicted phage terminase large subunit-like protein